MDRRKCPRLDIELPVRFVLRNDGNRVQQGRSVNMSRTGILIEADGDVAVAPGDAVDLELELAGGLAGGNRCLFCTGRVVRTEGAGPRMRFAVGIAVMSFRRPEVAGAVVAGHATPLLVM